MRCNICGSTETYVKNHEHNYQIKGKQIKFNLERRFCAKCNNLVYDEKLDNIASTKAISIYNKLYGIEKEQIINLRKKYNLSQELFSKVIGCAKKTLISYEKGTSIPNDSYLIVIKTLMENPEMISNIVAVNKVQFTDKEYNKTNNKISLFLENNEKQLLLNEEFVPTEYNGYTKLNKEKIYNIILFLARNTILKTKLLKEMFYIDFLFYKENCKSMTGLEYAKLPFGPVPNSFEKILTKGYQENIIDYELVNNSEKEYYEISAKKPFDKNLFTKEELEILNKVKQYFKNYNTSQIVEYSHQEKAFLNTNKNEKISYNYAFDIKLK